MTQTYEGSAPSVSAHPARDQRLGRDGRTQVRGERVEERRLRRRQRDVRPVDGRRAAPELEREAGSEHDALARQPVAQAPEHAIDPRPQLRVVVGLRDVVLGHLVEELRLRVGRVDRGEDDDREVGAGLDLSREGDPVEARHHHVDQDQVRPGVLQATQRLDPVARGRHVVAVRTELLGQDDQQVRVVVHEEQSRRAFAAAGPAGISTLGG